MDHVKSHQGRDFRLQLFDPIRLKLHDFTGFKINDMIVVNLIDAFVPGARTFKAVALDHPGAFQNAYGPIDCRDGDIRIIDLRTPMKLFYLRVVFGFANYPKQGYALRRDAQTGPLQRGGHFLGLPLGPHRTTPFKLANMPHSQLPIIFANDYHYSLHLQIILILRNTSKSVAGDAK